MTYCCGLLQLNSKRNTLLLSMMPQRNEDKRHRRTTSQRAAERNTPSERIVPDNPRSQQADWPSL